MQIALTKKRGRGWHDGGVVVKAMKGRGKRETVRV